MKTFDDLTDSEWAVIEDLFESGAVTNERRGRPPAATRVLVNAVLWLLTTGEGWYRLPGRFPSQPTCRRRFEKWQADGTLADALARLRTCGRDIPLRATISTRTTRSRAQALPPNGRLRGAFWTNPAWWRPGTGSDHAQTRPSDTSR